MVRRQCIGNNDSAFEGGDYVAALNVERLFGAARSVN
jgi:hypothetical protein